MSDREALRIFSRQPVSLDMINFLVATTNSIIQVKPLKKHHSRHHHHLSPSRIISINPTISLANFIKNLIAYSNVQTPTLMATLVYLNKLRNLLPANAVGMETTRHRIFLSALIVAAKSLNDSSPLNKHWTKYTDGLLDLDEVNLAERELINILEWNVTVKHEELVVALQPFLIGIKSKLLQQQEYESLQRINYYRLLQRATGSNYSIGSSNYSLGSSSSSISSHLSLSHSASTDSLVNENLNEAYSEKQPGSKRIPLANKSNTVLGSRPMIKKKRSIMSFIGPSSSSGSSSGTSTANRIIAA
ncbi:PHO85 cyclin-2 [Candida viswanathii]|uniref:PHO85 cyclin-2 n=1 Tax=Candida viswanathii TaxID=5486 RepID=A0A367YC23_9ASCO|nr:PHO85 cyclin-2 [Candida viswanathii]RCK66253.1 PHO85 cyclin-2 [Candida viswanathii]